MPSQTDLDQGGTFRQWVRSYFGPTVGWIMVQVNNILEIIATGTTTVAIGTTLVMVDVAAVVTVQLPEALADPTIPQTLTGLPITIVDTGGNAATFNITILPAAGETIMGLASLTISTNYGAYTLIPNTEEGGWNQQ